VVAGRILDPRRTVIGGGEIFGFGGTAGTPDRGLGERDGGPWSIALKQRSVSAPHRSLFVAEQAFLAAALASLPAEATLELLGAWVGAEAAARGRRVAFTPLVQAAALAGFAEPEPAHAEEAAFRRRHPTLVPDTRWYSRFLDRASGYALGAP
jgi:hypothetical protein